MCVYESQKGEIYVARSDRQVCEDNERMLGPRAAYPFCLFDTCLPQGSSGHLDVCEGDGMTVWVSLRGRDQVTGGEGRRNGEEK